MRRLFDRGHLFERRMRQRIVLTAFDFHYIRTKALIEGGGGGGEVVLKNFFVPNVVLFLGRCLIRGGTY